MIIKLLINYYWNSSPSLNTDRSIHLGLFILEEAPVALYNSLKGGYRQVTVGLFSHVTVTGWEVMALSGTRGSSGWILGNISSQRNWWGTGMGCPGRWWGHHPWRSSRTVEMWHWGTWLVGMVGMGWVGLDVIFPALKTLKTGVMMGSLAHLKSWRTCAPGAHPLHTAITQWCPINTVWAATRAWGWLSTVMANKCLYFDILAE